MLKVLKSKYWDILPLVALIISATPNTFGGVVAGVSAVLWAAVLVVRYSF